MIARHRWDSKLVCLVFTGRDALARYRDSIAIANTQGALAFELRAVVCLAELLVRIGYHNEAVRVATDL